MITLKRCAFLLAISLCLASLDTALAQATNSIKCSNGTTLTASVPGGSCTTAGLVVKCTNSSGDTATADCGIGACNSTGNGSCNRARAPTKPTKPTKSMPIATSPTSGSGVKPPLSGAKGTTVGAKQGPSGSGSPVLEARPSGGGSKH